jgi:hypothetical protein
MPLYLAFTAEPITTTRFAAAQKQGHGIGVTITAKDPIQAVEPAAPGIALRWRRFGYLRSFFLFWFFA